MISLSVLLAIISVTTIAWCYLRNHRDQPLRRMIRENCFPEYTALR